MQLFATELVVLSVLLFFAGLTQLLAARPYHDWRVRMARRLRLLKKPGPDLSPRRVLVMRSVGAVMAATSAALLLVVKPMPFHAGRADHAAAAAAASSPAGAIPAASADRTRQVVEEVALPHMESGRTVGLVIGVVDSAGPRVFGFGRARLGRSEPPDGDTMFEIGSINKVFTTLLLARMAEQGSVRLDQAVQELLPPATSGPATRSIRLEHLATHRSGLPRIPSNFGIVPADLVPALSDPYADYTTTRLYQYLANAKLESKPGEKVEYSNLGMGVLGHALGLAAGTDYETLVRREICEPLGMSDTRVTMTPEQESRHAQGYIATEPAILGWRLGLPAHRWSNPTLAGCGCLSSTANDMLQFLAANLGLMPTPLSAAMDSTLRPRYQEGERMQVALGWFVRQPKDGGEPIVWHNGGTGGFRSFAGMRRGARVGVIVLGNTIESVDRVGWEILKKLRGS
jgi:D-alanyl-D-alanine-carboxypeptidase/D-alanyl-D-alanine-endopeptidase